MNEANMDEAEDGVFEAIICSFEHIVHLNKKFCIALTFNGVRAFCFRRNDILNTKIHCIMIFYYLLN